MAQPGAAGISRPSAWQADAPQIVNVTDGIDVYVDQLDSQWQDWSWSTTANYATASPVHSGSHAIQVAYAAGWAGLQLGYHSASLDITGADSIVFWAHGGAAGGQHIRFTLSPTSQGAALVEDITLAADAWTRYEFPLASLGSPRQVYTLAWQNFSASIQPAIYLDDISFASSGSTPPPAPTDGPALSVDVALNRHPISPDIYGMNFMGANPGEAAFMDEIGLPVNRWGGNATSRYNWTINASNHALDWYFENLPQDLSADQFISLNKQHGVNTLLTLPMLGYVAKDGTACGFAISKYGPQQDSDVWRPNCGNGKLPNGNEFGGNDPLDTSLPVTTTFVTQWIEHLKANYGSASQGGVRYYNLDNEPALWNSTHRDVHPQPLSYEELKTRTLAYAAAIRAADPGAKIFGPAEWGWVGYFYSALDVAAGGDWWNNPPDRLAHQNVPLVEWYLQQMRAYEQSHGVRLLDYLDEHFYPQAGGVSLSPAGIGATQALRLRSTRSLWDPTYVDESWINDTVAFIPRMRQWVADNYPGTRMAIGEYNWGALDHINGALAQADVLGIFGREGLDLATLWSPPSPDQPGAFAFRMYRNYDGQGGRFGDTSVQAASADQAKLSIYAAQVSQGPASGSLTVIVINKSFGPLRSNLSVSGAGTLNGAWGYRYSAGNLAAIEFLGFQANTKDGLLANYPENSITLWVFSAQRPVLQPRVFLPVLTGSD